MERNLLEDAIPADSLECQTERVKMGKQREPIEECTLSRLPLLDDRELSHAMKPKNLMKCVSKLSTGGRRRKC